MGNDILAIFGVFGAAYGVLVFFVGRHVLHTMFDGGVIKTGATQGMLILAGGVILALLFVSGIVIKLMVILNVHKM
ncbi:hypothetical protein [Natronorubrum sp. FCH18a]|uniref:hypothetical protein n=1 Tax=Natronorubrum sp. FCH18a TaxID=3447018 RepID=UPI003F51883D